MNIAFLCPSISRSCGGIFEIERKLAQRLASLPRTEIEIYAPSDEHAEADLPSWHPLRPQHLEYRGPASFRYSANLRRAFMNTKADISHLHALWMYNSIILREWAKRRNRPYVITANGMLESWAIRNSGWKKAIALALYEKSCLTGAACIQVNSEAELKSVRKAGLGNPICIIPNGIDLPSEGSQSTRTDTQTEHSWTKQIPQGSKLLLYLGRIHPKKGLENLLSAWAIASRPPNPPSDWVLAIAGWDQGGHLAELKRLASDLNVTSSVSFPGPQFGSDKSACYLRCDAFILPSYSEGLPMVVLEAWSYGKPVLMTLECNLPEGFSARSALRIGANAESIARGLTQLFEMSEDERRKMGQRGTQLAISKFDWQKIATDMRSVYAWILGSGPKPECVSE